MSDKGESPHVHRRQGVRHARGSKAVRNGSAATVAVVAPVTESVIAAFSQTGTAAGVIVTGTTEVWTPLVQSAAGTVRGELSDGFAVQVEEVAGRTVGVYQQAVNGRLGLCLVLADVRKVGWISGLTRSNATASPNSSRCTPA